MAQLVADTSDGGAGEISRGPFAADLLAHGLGRDPSHPALILANGETLTAAQLADATSRYSQALRSFNLPVGARVGLLARNRPEVVHVLNALLFADLCVVPLHPMGAIDDFSYIIDDAGLSCLIFDPDIYADQVAILKDRHPNLEHVFALGSTKLGADLIGLAMAKSPQKLVPPGGDPEAIERMAYTGGTTGSPKGVLLSRRSLAATYAIQMADWEWPENPKALLCAPLSHSGSALLIPTLLRGGSLMVLPGFDPVAVLTAIQEQKINCILLVPTMIYALLDHPRFDEFDLSSMECIYYGASAISPARLREGIARIGPVFFQFFGQSEAPMTVSVMRRAEHDVTDDKRLSSCGRAVSSVRISLRDDADVEVSNGQPGEVCVQGPLIMSGYWNKPEQTAEVFRNGWLHTGDIAVRDEDGFLRIVDRKKDMIITGGFNVYPREVEDVLIEHPNVAQACVVGMPDPHWGETVVALVVPRSGMIVIAEELIALVRSRKGAVQAPKRIILVDAIPLSGLGKPDKKAVRASLAKQEV